MHRLSGLSHLLSDPSAIHLIELLGIVAVVACALWWLCRASVTLVISLGFAAEVFSGNWKYVPFPIPLDRVLLGLGLLLLVLRGVKVTGARRIRVLPLHFLLLAVVVYAICSAWAAGTLTSSYGFYALLDRLGVLPFLFFTLSPIIFNTQRQRDTLMTAMVIIGLYLGLTGLFEGLGLHSLVFPRYINNQSLGITPGRTRGPFLESVAMGLSVFDCAVFASIGLGRWKRRSARVLCFSVIGLSTLDVFLTLTRSVWIGAAVGAVGVAVLHPRLRRMLPVGVALVVVIVVALLDTVPGLRSKFSGRVDTTTSIWDRYNTNNAALRAFESHPVFGIGWQTFETKSIWYLREAGTYPLTGVGLEVHNVFLSHLAELGLVGALLWGCALLAGVGGAVVRPCRDEMRPWRYGLTAVFLMYVVVANFVPLSYAFPNLIMWTLAGIVSAERNSVPRSSTEATEGSGDLETARMDRVLVSQQL